MKNVSHILGPKVTAIINKLVDVPLPPGLSQERRKTFNIRWRIYAVRDAFYQD